MHRRQAESRAATGCSVAIFRQFDPARDDQQKGRERAFATVGVAGRYAAVGNSANAASSAVWSRSSRIRLYKDWRFGGSEPLVSFRKLRQISLSGVCELVLSYRNEPLPENIHKVLRNVIGVARANPLDKDRSYAAGLTFDHLGGRLQPARRSGFTAGYNLITKSIGSSPRYSHSKTISTALAIRSRCRPSSKSAAVFW